MKAKRYGCIIVLLGSAATAHASENAESPARDTDAVAARLMAAVQVIEENHFDRPTQQELVQRLMQGIADEFKTSVDRERRGSQSPTADDIEMEATLSALLLAVIDKHSAGRTDEPLSQIEEAALQHLLRDLAGSNHLRSQKEQALDEQFAGNRYVGTGIALRLDNKARVLQLATVLPNGPAFKAGAKAGDLLLEIDGQPTGMDIVEAVRRIRGPAGTDVTFVLRQPQEQQERRLTITRGVVPFKHTQVEYQDTAAVITINHITAAIVQELRDIDDELPESIDKVELNFGSYRNSDLHHAVLLADALLEGGTIGRAKTTRGIREFAATRECLFGDRPLSVRVSRDTSRTLEWIAAALQDNNRARIVGQRTAGEPFITDAFDVPGTDWVLELTCGVLERADGRPLLSTQKETPIDRVKVVPVRLPDGTGNSIIVQPPVDTHDGGVVPDELIELRPSKEFVPPVPAPHNGTDLLRSLKNFFLGQPESE